jgi:hypothetical protein
MHARHIRISHRHARLVPGQSPLVVWGTRILAIPAAILVAWVMVYFIVWPFAEFIWDQWLWHTSLGPDGLFR